MWKQLKTPNLDPVVYQGGKVLYNWLGWCLAVAETMFGVPRLYATAWEGWNATKKKHGRNDNIPTDVYLPIWFDGWCNGHRYGHVAIIYINSSNGSVKIWSSPISNKPYADVWTSIPQVEKAYGMTYVGWSEDIAGVNVVEWVANTATVAQITALFRELLERDPDQKALDYYQKLAYDAVRNDIINSPERQKLLAKKEADRKAADEAKRRAEEARIAAEKAAAEAKAKKEREEAERLAEEARRAQEEADRLAEEERKKKEEQAANSSQWKDLEAEQKKTNNLLQQILQLVQSLIDKLTKIFK